MSNINTYLQRLLFTPLDAASVAVFRMGFGLVMLIDAVGHLTVAPLDAMFVNPDFMFRYYLFEWVPLLREWVYPLYDLIALASVGIMVGKFYRSSATIVTLGTAWIFLQDQALYLNHMYMLILYSGLMIFLPANCYWSLDARKNPAIRSETLPSWVRLALILQIEFILIYAGLVKINGDWLALEPLATWLAMSSGMPFLGGLFVQKWAVAIAAYGVICLHLIGAPLLLLRKTRLYVIGLYACFHTLNHFLFEIGVFPWVTLFASLICFDPDWPRQLRAWFRRQSYRSPKLTAIATPSVQKRRVVILMLAIWIAYQVLMPARSLVYEGNVAWNELGHRFSWRMKLRGKEGAVVFIVVDPASGRRLKIDPKYLLPDHQIFKMPCQPDMILQMAHYLRDIVAPEILKFSNPEIYASGVCSLNYRRPVPLIDPEVNLAVVTRHLGNNDWVLPLDVPLSDRRTGALPRRFSDDK